MRYHSSPDCEIYINNILAREAVLVDFTENSSKMPIHSWRNKYFHTVANGNVLVSGSLIYNQGIPKYLDLLAEGTDPHADSRYGEDPVESLRRNISESLNNLSVVTSTNIESVKRAARLNRLLNFKSPETNGVPFGPRLRGVEITIKTPDMETVIYGVHFSSKSSQVDATRSDNIKLASSFIGQRLVERNL